MPTVYLSPGPFGVGGQFFDSNGKPLNAGRISTYAAGTTTPTATYTTSAGNIQNPNPIILNSDGRPPQEIWMVQATGYKFELVDSVSNSIQTYDNLYSIGDPTTNQNIGYTGATISGTLVMNQAPINEAQGANIPVASAINLTTSTGNYLSLTGSGTVTAIQLSQGAYRELVVNTVSAAFVNSATMALLGGGSFTPAVGDILGFRGEASPVVRQVLYQAASGISVIPKAGPNTVLAGPTVSTASATAPTFRTLSGFDGASWVLLSSGAASASATFEFTNQIDATYDQYAVLMSNVVPVTNTSNLTVQVGTSLGTTYVTVSYHFATWNFNDAAASGAGGGTAATNITLCTSMTNNGGQGFGGWMLFEQPATAAHFKMFNAQGTYITAPGALTQFLIGGSHEQNGEAISRIRFLMSSGNIATGNFALYGIRKG